MTTERQKTISLRMQRPDLWAEVVRTAREIVGDGWSEDEIASVMGKVVAPSPDVLMDHIGHVLCWCAGAEQSDDEEAQATVSLWKTLPVGLIEITVDEDGRLSHRISPDVDVRFEDTAESTRAKP